MNNILPVAFDAAQLYRPAMLGSVLLIIAAFWVYRSWTGKGWVIELLAGIGSAGVGCILGLGAQSLYTSGGEIPLFGNGYENPAWVGGIVGGAFGFVAGVWFAQFLRKQPSDEHGTMVVKSIPAGLALGVICSMAVHGILMVAYHNLHFGPMLIGIIFGIGGGILTGVVISFFYVMANRLGLIKTEEGT